jgi:glycosyltransferase involved in cell wall biosynthesis
MRRLIILCLFPFYSLLVAWREGIEIFVAFGTLYAFIQVIAKWILKRPMVTLIRGDSSFGMKVQDSPKSFLWLNRWIEYMGLLFSDRIVTVNTAFQGEIVSLLGKKKKVEVQVLFNNILFIPTSVQENIHDTRDQLGIPPEAKVLVTAGVLSRAKNIELLLKILPKTRVDHLFLLVSGDVSKENDQWYKDYLENLTDRLGMEQRVIFTGWLEKRFLWRVFQEADLFVLPSLREGMPNAMLEAMGADLPCIGSRVPGIMDILKHEELMFDPFDEKEIVSKINQFFLDVQYSNYINGLCRERKNNFVFDWKERVFKMVTEGIFS